VELLSPELAWSERGGPGRIRRGQAKLTDLLEVPVPKKHSDIRKLLLCCTLGLVSLIGSPCTASISALLTNAQTSTFFPELASSGTFALFCSELAGRLAGRK